MRIKIDHNSIVPFHQQAEDILRKLINDPQYLKGELLPKEVQLSEQMGISRATLRQALNKLVYEGLLIRKKGVGTRVAEKKLVCSKSKNWLSFSQEMGVRGIQVRNFELHICWVLPDESIADFFEIDGTKKILKLVRLSGNGTGPFVYFESFFHPRIGLTGEEDFKQPLYEILEKEYGIVAFISREEVSADTADQEMAAKLEISEGGPLLIRKRYVYDIHELPIEFNIGTYRADSFVYTVESRRE
jgi:GntR family transcriptional regulator